MLPQAKAVVRMPEVVGMTLQKAKLLIEGQGLVVDAILFQESYESRDTVLVQKPARGQMIYVGEHVTLTISRESYLRWMPSIYQRNDPSGRNFLRDILWVVQHMFASVEDKLDVIHTFFDAHEAPEEFLPWLASWSAMVLDEDWPIEKKRRLIKKAIELYRIRGTVKGLKLFIALFTGHEPEIYENVWPFRGCRIGVTSGIGVDTVVLPPVNLAHTFIVEMPVTYQDISVEAVIRIHEIVQMEKPAHAQYYLRFAVEERPAELREFFVIGARSGIGIGAEVTQPITSEAELEAARVEVEAKKTVRMTQVTRAIAAQSEGGADDPFAPVKRLRAPLPKAARADNAPVEGQEPRSREAGFGQSARQLEAVSETQVLKAQILEQESAPTITTVAVNPDAKKKKTGEHEAVKPDKPTDKGPKKK